VKILVLAPAYAPSTGGVEKHIQRVNREFRAQGHEVVVLVRHNLFVPQRQMIDGVDVWRLPASDSLPSMALWYYQHRQVFEGIDVVHSHDYYPRRLHQLLSSVRWVHTFHGYEGWPIDPAAIDARQIVREEVNACFGIGAFIEKWYGTKLDYITYGAADEPSDTPAIKHGADLVFIGRLESDTGFEDYLKGFALIHRQHPKVRLAVLGDGQLRHWGEEFVRTEQLPVSFEGWQDDTAPYQRAAKVVLVSGYLAILEAARLEKPILAHYGTPIKHDYLACHPLASKFVTANSPETVAEGYERALQLPYITLADSAAWAKQQTWEALGEQYLRVYKRY
jgi:glycosyltransferase involved in cell wall biosynthesis